MLSKRKIINALFVLSFPWYGFGAYRLAAKGFAEGILVCTVPYVLILSFYLIDLGYKQVPLPKVNRKFYLVLGALLSAAVSILVGLHYKSPLINPANGTLLIILYFSPFLSAVVLHIYNRNDPGFDPAWLITKGLLAYVAVNVLGMAAGMHNRLHSFAGRASPPFAVGIYDAAHILALLNLILMVYLMERKPKLLHWVAMAAAYGMNMLIMLSINSRLSVMIFVVLTALFATKVMKSLRGLYTVALFTVPIMMTFGQLIYQVLSLPVFASFLERVNEKDITTFNGRTYLWQAGAEWIWNDRRGFLFGNGFNGHYHLRLLTEEARMFGSSNSAVIHFHSSFFEILINQGIVGILLMYGVFWVGYKFYRHQYSARLRMAPLYAGFVYFMFTWQIDIENFSYNMGFMVLFVLMGPVVMARNTPEPFGMPAEQLRHDGR